MLSAPRLLTRSSFANNHAASKTTLLRSMVDFDNPSVLPSASHLPLHRGGKMMVTNPAARKVAPFRRALSIMTQAGFPCAAGLNLRIPARVAARRILRAFGTADRRAFYACRSSFAKIFSNENILARLRFICTSARRISRAFGTADRRAFYACRSFFAKIFSRENILAISYNVVAKGFTCYAFCAPICCSRSFCGKVNARAL